MPVCGRTSEHCEHGVHWSGHCEACAKPQIHNVTGFSDFAEPFCAGWNAHRRHGNVSGEEFVKVLMEAFRYSGPEQAKRVFEAMTNG